MFEIHLYDHTTIYGLSDSGVFAKKTIPVRSLFGPLDAPVISKTRMSHPAEEATTVWKKKYAMQKAMENLGTASTSANEGTDNNHQTSPVISHIRSVQPQPTKAMTQARAAEVAISSIQQQLMSITSQSISQNAEIGILGIQPLQSSPININQSNQQHGIADLNNINFHGGSPNLQLSHEQLNSIQQHFQGFGQNELAAMQQNLNLSDYSAANHMAPIATTDQSASMLVQDPASIEIQIQPADGLVDSSQLNVPDISENLSENATDSSQTSDMNFELKVSGLYLLINFNSY